MPGRGDRRDLGYLREDERELGARFATSRRSGALVALAARRAARSSAAPPQRGVRAEHDALNFPLCRAFAGTLSEGDEIVVTALDHDANVSPWLELARDRGLRGPPCGHADRRIRARLRRSGARSSPRERACVAFPVAANAMGTAHDVGAIVELAHAAGALAWADAVHYAPHGPIDVAAWDVDVLICSPYKFFGPHLGLAFGKRRAARVLARRTRCGRGRRAARPPLRAGTASTSSWPASSPPSTTSSRSAGTRSSRTSARSASASSAGLPETRAPRPPRWTGACRPSASTCRGRSAEEVAVFSQSADRGLVRRLLRPRGHAAPRSPRRRRPRRHRPLQHRGRGRRPARRARRAVRMLVLGGTKFLGRSRRPRALERGPRV